MTEAAIMLVIAIAALVAWWLYKRNTDPKRNVVIPPGAGPLITEAQAQEQWCRSGYSTGTPAGDSLLAHLRRQLKNESWSPGPCK